MGHYQEADATAHKVSSNIKIMILMHVNSLLAWARLVWMSTISLLYIQKYVPQRLSDKSHKVYGTLNVPQWLPDTVPLGYGTPHGVGIWLEKNSKLSISCFLTCPTRLVGLAYYYKCSVELSNSSKTQLKLNFNWGGLSGVGFAKNASSIFLNSTQCFPESVSSPDSKRYAMFLKCFGFLGPLCIWNL